ncbi:hypothetical protein [Nocardioides bruguierae]|uniref:hypothetical protein n=1 Tax=Nocardioides bruguierae TaxID=2945102 RepID=UPI00202117E1|nr:hypothetical protein [Nocardioides bruguierae]MCL8026667.1 hypothetical protein [Nocardioides bruguierae]
MTTCHTFTTAQCWTTLREHSYARLSLGASGSCVVGFAVVDAGLVAVRSCEARLRQAAERGEPARLEVSWSGPVSGWLVVAEGRLRPAGETERGRWGDVPASGAPVALQVSRVRGVDSLALGSRDEDRAPGVDRTERRQDAPGDDTPPALARLLPAPVRLRRVG